MDKIYIKNTIKQIVSLIQDHPTIVKLSKKYPGFALSKIEGQVLKSENERLALHICSLYEHALEIRKLRGVREADWVNSVIAIFFHDISKVLFNQEEELSWQERKILGNKEHHSLATSRLFLAVNDIVLAHAVRHNSSDFVYDLAGSNISIPQLVLNLVDKSDIGGRRVSIEEKYQHIKNKIGDVVGYDDDSERIACFYLSKILSENRNLYDYEFINQKKIKKESITFIQRFDGKYCAPIGLYQDTNSNLKIAEIISGWGFKTLLVHGGDVYHKYSDNIQLVGFPDEIKSKMIPMYCFDKNLVIVEGTTSRLLELKNMFGKYKKVVLLLRTLAQGTVEDYRVNNMQFADEIWVLTPEMENILQKVFLEKNIKSPGIKVLQSGYDQSIFFCDNTPRQRGKIVYVGALTEIKGVDVLIEAFKRVRAEFPYVELHLIGDEKIYGDINTFPKNLYENVEGIFSYGCLRQNEVAHHLRSAHFSCLLTKIYETFGKAAMQARVCGTRMIVSSKGALPFHVQNEQEGIVLDEVDVDSVYNAIKNMLESDPVSVLPPEDRYNQWLHTALDFYSYNVLLTRKTIFN